MKNRVDLHGLRLEELDKVLDTIVINALSQGITSVELITGVGPLQKEIMKMCSELYNYHVYIPMSNKGIVILDME